MNKRQVIASLNEVADELDNAGLFKEATAITNVMKKLSQNTSLISNSGMGAGGDYTPGIQGMIPSMTKPYEPLGPKNPIAEEDAQKWINSMSYAVDGDIQKLYSLAVKGKQLARSDQSAKKFNDAMAILKNHPKFNASTSMGNVRGYDAAQEAKAKKFPY